MSAPILHEFAVSHFCEKARWGLTWLGVPFERRVHIPGTQGRKMKALGGARTSVPVLQLGDRSIQGSDAIIDYAESVANGRSLAPSDVEAAREEEAWLDLELGEMARSVLYRDLINDRAALVELWTQDGPWWGKPAVHMMFPMARKGISMMYVTKPRLLESAERLEAAIVKLDARYGAQPYLVDDRFTRLDLTVAALLAPLCRPPQHPFRWPDRPTPPGAAAIRDRHIDGPTLQRVLALYAEHR
jgi:glutathione S-transferase